ncbi:MAG: hypothetical protein JRN39_03975 [Nitrososphaerota archaeon]|nr:hypothetical protein [Nitrososphaerota archaeon]MDG6939542.1 hypothetical protein [Nitrososphaerota archaeon]
MERELVVKIGGSFATDKGTPFSVRRDALRSAAESLSGWQGGMAFVHGGGSFGHPLAMKYGLSAGRLSPASEGVAETREAMQRLSGIVQEQLRASGFRPFVIPPVSVFGMDGEARPDLGPMLRSLMGSGLNPLSYGDVSIFSGGFRIVSGDRLSYLFCRALRPGRMVFVMDQPGILRDPADPSTKLDEVAPDELERFARGGDADATGGFATKLATAAMIARDGTDVCFVSGFDKDALIRSLSGEKGAGTVVRGLR